MGTRTEVEQLQHQANKVTDDSLESTRRMLSLLLQCDDMEGFHDMIRMQALVFTSMLQTQAKEGGIRSLVGLDEQGGLDLSHIGN
ncbi:hypothetical protein HAZT_HAZT002054 [Hyalella azteca]|uniref:Uncharacterized protein n=1 Tax=Hyalella azteca TaxID=294128 RepID=A0A6A0HA06_HYAAZ|nr:hypothetical protein HAZT_HAZT002054 [Hyalella azteca]